MSHRKTLHPLQKLTSVS